MAGRLSLVLADLHMHSTVSDGWRDPDEVAHLAADRGVRVMALTDHDTFHGVNRARAVAHRRGLGYVRALEVTTYPPNQMRHILGHGVDVDHPRLLALLHRTQGVFRRQTEAWIRVLHEQGIGEGLDLGAFAFKPTVMPGAVLKLILQHGLMTEGDAWASVRRAVDFMPPDFYSPIPSPKEAVDAIHAAGGLAVHAHPGSVPDQDLMKEVLPLIDGLEVYTRRHKPEQIPVYEELAARHGLLMTVGSDYHGFNGDDYEAPRKLIDIRYLEKLGSRVEWPALEKAG
ncbi:MAG: PHP domain-containing protein [Chloroflexi bacterium]|nr:MAG: PHP domain-containing protein [Chloroflexota bacterium]TMD83081.1 MAG: PHP domain-containing protein [Chloroflexota bacterium]